MICSQCQQQATHVFWTTDERITALCCACYVEMGFPSDMHENCQSTGGSMNFAQSLERLREAASGPKGEQETVRVRRADLYELLEHFDRLDRQVRDDAHDPRRWAAPDMLAFAQLALTIGPHERAVDYLHAQARAVIKKATGEV